MVKTKNLKNKGTKGKVCILMHSAKQVGTSLHPQMILAVKVELLWLCICSGAAVTDTK